MQDFVAVVLAVRNRRKSGKARIASYETKDKESAWVYIFKLELIMLRDLSYRPAKGLRIRMAA